MLSNKYIQNFKNINTHIETEFELHNVPVSLANSIRRILLSEIPIVAFDDVWDDRENYRSINIKKNTSGIHNEFLAHRLSLIPIDMNNKFLQLSTKFNNIIGIRQYNFNSNNIPEFKIAIKNIKQKSDDAQRIITVTSEHLELNENHEISKENIKFFNTDPYTNDYPILNILKPNVLNPDNGEEIELIAKPNFGTGNINSRYCPVGTVSYSFITDEEDKVNKVFEQKIKYKNTEREDKELPKYTDLEKQILKKSFDFLDSQRVYCKNIHGDANKFKFVVESIGFLPANNLIYDSFIILELKLFDILNSIIIDESNIIFNENKMKIFESNDDLLGYIIEIKNENHTLGNLLSDYFKILYCKNNNPIESNFIVFSSYRMPHPLTQTIEIKLKLNSNLDNNLYKFYYELYSQLYKTKPNVIQTIQNSILKLDIVKMLFIKTINYILNDLDKIKKEIKNIPICEQILPSFVIKDDQAFFENNRLN